MNNPENLDDYYIDNIKILKYFSTNDEEMLDRLIAKLEKSDLLVQKKLGAILYLKKNKGINSKAIDIIGDKIFLNSIFDSSLDINRLKNIIKFELDPRVNKSWKNRYHYQFYNNDHVKDELERLNSIIRNTRDKKPNIQYRKDPIVSPVNHRLIQIINNLTVEA